MQLPIDKHYGGVLKEENNIIVSNKNHQTNWKIVIKLMLYLPRQMLPSEG